MSTPARRARIAERRRSPRWAKAPVAIDMPECIHCDECVRACPPGFGAIFRRGVAYVVIPELCSGCGRCVPACPVDCIRPDPGWGPAPERWWLAAGRPGADPYVPPLVGRDGRSPG